MGAPLSFRILGPLEVTLGTRALPLGGPKQRAILAFLLLHANEPVTRERLIDEVWGDAAPATVNAVLNVYLSRLRRLLGNGEDETVLATRSTGYVLTVSPEQIDAARFEGLVEMGRRRLARGQPEPARRTLREALALWRGPALADVSYDEFAQRAIARLEELRLTALEERIEADMRLGRHSAVVPELEQLVAEHPYRERLRAHLMLALYRCGRQAEALETYRRARRQLASELGLEPGPELRRLEQAILNHDEALDASRTELSRRRTGHTVRTRRSRSLVALALAGALGLAVAMSATAWLATRSTHHPLTLSRLAGNSIAVIDPDTNTLVDEIPVGGRPSGVAVGFGSIWVVNRDDETLLRIDPRSRTVLRTIGLGSQPSGIAVGAGSVWVGGDGANSLLRIDPVSNDVVGSVVLPGATRCCGLSLAAGPNGVWASHLGILSRIDPRTDRLARLRDHGVFGITYANGDLWALTGRVCWPDTIERAGTTGWVADRISPVRAGSVVDGLRWVAVGAGSVWTATAVGDELLRADPVTGRLTGITPLRHKIDDAVVTDDAVWAAARDGTVLRVEPGSGRVVTTIRLGGAFPASLDTVGGLQHAVAAGEGAVWVAVTL